jgi:hypothetical protein
MEKRSLKLSASLATDVMDDPEPFNTSSNGRDTRRAITLGNQRRKFTPPISSKPITVSAH